MSMLKRRVARLALRVPGRTGSPPVLLKPLQNHGPWRAAEARLSIRLESGPGAGQRRGKTRFQRNVAV